jgi:hypothetical protein
VSDPLRTLWDALANGGYSPRGRLEDFRARCPAHQGDNPTSLHVRAGVGGQALVWCFAHGCPVEEIVKPLGLNVRDLFPLDPGHDRRLRNARRDDFEGNAREVANVLLALERLGARWSLAIWLDECPNCERPHAQLSIDSTGDPRVYCGRGCDVRMVGQALADRLANPRRRAA